MKKVISGSILFFCLFTAAHAQVVSMVSGNAVKKTAIAVLNEVTAGNAYLVDVRTPEEYHAGHLAHTQNIDYNGADFGKAISKLNKQKTVYLYCRSGNRSGKALDTLRSFGFKKYYNLGGLEKLKTEGFPVE